MRQFRYLWSAIPLPVLIMLAGCSASQHDPQEQYYLLSANVKIPYWQAAANGLSRAASQLGVKGEMVGPDSYDAQAEHHVG